MKNIPVDTWNEIFLINPDVALYSAMSSLFILLHPPSLLPVYSVISPAQPGFYGRYSGISECDYTESLWTYFLGLLQQPCFPHLVLMSVIKLSGPLTRVNSQVDYSYVSVVSILSDCPRYVFRFVLFKGFASGQC